MTQTKTTLLFLLIILTQMSAQQANQFTQFGYTKSYYNPALASAEDNLSLSLIHI